MRLERNFESLIENITFLRINNESWLEFLPTIICRMRLTEVLDLSNNSITRLPIGCFMKLAHLRKLRLGYNKISELQKETFLGLELLDELSISHNDIFFIDPETFSNRSDLMKLGYLDLGYNQLTSIDSWPLARAQAKPGVIVILSKQQNKKLHKQLKLEFQMWDAAH